MPMGSRNGRREYQNFDLGPKYGCLVQGNRTIAHLKAELPNQCVLASKRLHTCHEIWIP